jgi:hypothetical protein
MAYAAAVLYFAARLAAPARDVKRSMPDIAAENG